MALQHLLKSYSASTILIGGDSAGGNLTAALLGHLMHPHPAESIPRVTLSEPLLGAVLISPWVGFDISRASYQANEYLDVIPAVAVQRWSNAFMGDAKPDNYNQPVLAPSSWWEDVPVKDVLITGGGEEVLIDEIREFAFKFKVRRSIRMPLASTQINCHCRDADDFSHSKEGHPATEILIAKGEPHDQFIGNAIMGSPPGESDGAIYAWIAAR